MTYGKGCGDIMGEKADWGWESRCWLDVAPWGRPQPAEVQPAAAGQGLPGLAHSRKGRRMRLESLS